jgi:hypothetical protein
MRRLVCSCSFMSVKYFRFAESIIALRAASVRVSVTQGFICSSVYDKQ